MKLKLVAVLSLLSFTSGAALALSDGKNTVTVTATVRVNNGIELSVTGEPSIFDSDDVEVEDSSADIRQNGLGVIFQGRPFTNLILGGTHQGVVETDGRGIAEIRFSTEVGNRVEVTLEY